MAGPADRRSSSNTGDDDGEEGAIRLLLAGQHWEAAFERIVSAYQGKVFRLCYSILGRRATAEDAAQEALLRAWRALARYNNAEAKVYTWLYAIARNTALSAREYESRRNATPLDSIPEPRERDTTAHSSSGEDEQELWNLVASLRDPYRRAIVLFYTEEKSYEEVSLMLGIPLNTVRTHLHRARKLLGAMIEERQQP